MESKLQALKVPDLKKLLQDANLPVSGTKAELIKRLLENPTSISSLGGEEEEEDLLGEYEADATVKETPKEQPVTKTTATSTTTTAPTVASAAKAEVPPSSSSPAVAPPVESEEDQKAALIAELEKRKARAARWGLSTGEAEAKLERAIKFGLESKQDATLKVLDGGLKGGKKREGLSEKKAVDVGTKPTNSKASAAPVAKPAETEEEKAARIARQEADEAAKKKRAERFGLPVAPAAASTAPASSAKSPSVAVDPAEEERKRKRIEKFGTTSSAEPSDKKIKA